MYTGFQGPGQVRHHNCLKVAEVGPYTDTVLRAIDVGIGLKPLSLWLHQQASGQNRLIILSREFSKPKRANKDLAVSKDFNVLLVVHLCKADEYAQVGVCFLELFNGSYCPHSVLVHSIQPPHSSLHSDSHVRNVILPVADWEENRLFSRCDFRQHWDALVSCSMLLNVLFSIFPIVGFEHLLQNSKLSISATVQGIPPSQDLRDQRLDLL
mmetsp:Transcript_5433/g.15102  ORF Transcript_5433/g.15102 Transcript_5433/m.15102 type:complete len:211 (-) Transcript_5433:25-657(-)